MSLDRPNQLIVRPRHHRHRPDAGRHARRRRPARHRCDGDGDRTQMGLEVTLTTGTSPSPFVAGTPITLFTIAMPAGGLPIYQTNPSYCTVDPSKPGGGAAHGRRADGGHAVAVDLPRPRGVDAQLRSCSRLSRAQAARRRSPRRPRSSSSSASSAERVGLGGSVAAHVGR